MQSQEENWYDWHILWQSYLKCLWVQNCDICGFWFLGIFRWVSQNWLHLHCIASPGWCGSRPSITLSTISNSGCWRIYPWGFSSFLKEEFISSRQCLRWLFLVTTKLLHVDFMSWIWISESSFSRTPCVLSEHNMWGQKKREKMLGRYKTSWNNTSF